NLSGGVSCGHGNDRWFEVIEGRGRGRRFGFENRQGDRATRHRPDCHCEKWNGPCRGGLRRNERGHQARRRPRARRLGDGQGRQAGSRHAFRCASNWCRNYPRCCGSKIARDRGGNRENFVAGTRRNRQARRSFKNFDYCSLNIAFRRQIGTMRQASGRQAQMPHQASDPFWQNPRSQQAVSAPVATEGGAICAGVLVFIGYYLGARVGFALTFHPHPISVFWPPNSILLAALLLTPPRIWWFLLLAAFPAHLISELQSDVPVGMVVCWFVSNCSEAVIGAGLIRYLVRGP